MTTESLIVISLTLYKSISLLVGLTSIYLGYNLFIKNIWGQAGDLDVKFKDNKLVLKEAAPGTFFALFGAILISITLIKGLEYNKYSSSGLFNGSESGKQELPVYQNQEKLPDESPLNK